MKKIARINIKATSQLKDDVVAHVKRNEKSISAYVTRLITQDLKDKS